MWLAVTALLMLLSYSTRDYFSTYTTADNDFAHTLAGEMLTVLEPIYIDDDSVCDKVWQQRLTDDESRFAEWKNAATHFKGQLAEDFVFAFALAEDGCRRAIEAQDRPDGPQRRFASQLLRRAQEQFRLIAVKDYRQEQRGR